MTPIRKCVGCGGRSEKAELIRIAAGADGAVIDPTGKAIGRGAYLHKNRDCVKNAKKKSSLERALRRKVSDGLYEELERLNEQQA